MKRLERNVRIEGVVKYEEVCIDNGRFFPYGIFLKTYSNIKLSSLKLEDDVSTVLIHNLYDVTLAQYLNSLKLKKIKCVMTYNVLETRNIYSYVLHEYRKLVRGLINFVLDLHRKKMLLKNLNLDNWSIIGDEIKEWGWDLLCGETKLNNAAYVSRVAVEHNSDMSFWQSVIFDGIRYDK